MTQIDAGAPRPFVPVKFAILTVSDSRQQEDDRSGTILVERLLAAGHILSDRAIVKDDRQAIQAQAKAWIADDTIQVIISTGGTGFTGRDITPEAMSPLFDKHMDGFSWLFHKISFEKIGTTTIQSRATAGLAGTTFIFCIPGSPGACKDAWDGIFEPQFDYRHMPSNFVELMPRLDEHLK
ncbi:molybdenum cofactor biosynthesis protein B [uncultured Cohaesibacter sp.]|uniref:molybdenum cofactor biosynthesis protein B n=1 Tax=uncultured Cohaesibacter sp. TaxID=1002546 RepID=UPI00292E9653|nr:molybdenum cofactor biosynthesis protein B [uncultured Cohaesibacter sp.]